MSTSVLDQIFQQYFDLQEPTLDDLQAIAGRLKQYLDTNPRDGQALSFMASLWNEIGDVRKAEKYAKDCLRQDRHDFTAHLVLIDVAVGNQREHQQVLPVVTLSDAVGSALAAGWTNRGNRNRIKKAVENALDCFKYHLSRSRDVNELLWMVDQLVHTANHFCSQGLDVKFVLNFIVNVSWDNLTHDDGQRQRLDQLINMAYAGLA